MNTAANSAEFSQPTGPDSHQPKRNWRFDDPAGLSNDPGKQLREFRIIRDQILQRLRLFVLFMPRMANSHFMQRWASGITCDSVSASDRI